MLRLFALILFLGSAISGFASEDGLLLLEKQAPISRIGIIFALPETERGASESTCPIPWFSNSERSREGKRTYYSGDYFGKYLVVSSLWPNKVSSAVVACNMILKHNVDLILIIGTCYSRANNSCFGDVLISQGYINYDADVRPFFERFEIPDIKQSIFKTNTLYKEAIKEGGKKFLLNHKKEIQTLLQTYGYLKPTTETQHTLTEGLVATGESFAMSRNYFLSLQKLYPDILGFDSASGAVSQVCYEYNTPCLGVNIVVPHPLESPSKESWQMFQTATSKIYMDTLLKSVLSELCVTH